MIHVYQWRLSNRYPYAPIYKPITHFIPFELFKEDIFLKVIANCYFEVQQKPGEEIAFGEHSLGCEFSSIGSNHGSKYSLVKPQTRIMYSLSDSK